MHDDQRRPPDARKYLRYDTTSSHRFGLLHASANLKCLLVEAWELGRLAILPSLTLDPMHNFGVARDWQWDTYFDFGAGRLENRLTGASWPLPIALPPRTLSVPRHLATVPGRVPPSPLRRIARAPSRAVSPDQPAAVTPSPLAAGSAAAPLRIAAKLRQHGIERNTPVYFLSDERDPAFWSALQGHCRVVRYPDFAQLPELVAQQAGRCPDNYLLFAVEQEILRHAKLGIGTTRGLMDVPIDDWLLSHKAPTRRRVKRRLNRLRRWIRPAAD